MSRDAVRLRRPPAGFRLVEQDLSTWVDDRLTATEEAARAAGFAAGYAEAMAGAAGSFEAAAERLDADREEAVEALSTFATRFAGEVAKHLLRLEIRDQAHDIEAMVRATLAEAGVGRGKCVVHVNPKDAAVLADVSFRSGTEVEADGSVPHGSVQVTTPRGLLVRDVEACIRHAADRIHGELRVAGRRASEELAPQASAAEPEPDQPVEPAPEAPLDDEPPPAGEDA